MSKKTVSDLKGKYDTVIKALNSYRFSNPLDINMDKLFQNDKKYLRIFSFNGLHENYFIGNLGSMELIQRGKTG